MLSPAGDRECLVAALENGADAVYFGLQRHNARIRANNFDGADLSEIMATLHRRGARGYVTLNTLIFPGELADVEATVRELVEAGVDAVIIQDLGLARLIRAICPEMEIHASTQMSITSEEGVRLASELGCSRVILARELSLDEIRKIRCQTEVPVEVFVHGALCVAYSGQCLTSEALGGRSANRGECAQACRMPYQIVCDGRDVDLGDVQYLLSPQDLAAYDLVPRLIELGVASLKIEGRLKAPEYVANITRHYRRAIDAALSSEPAGFTARDVEEMQLSFSRGFSHGFLDGNDHKFLVRGDYAKKRGLLVGRVAGLTRQGVLLEQPATSVKPGDGLVFDGDEQANVPEQGGRVYEVFPRPDGLVELRFGRDAIRLQALRHGQRAWKTDDPELTARLRRTFEGHPSRLVDLDLVVSAKAGEPLRVQARTAAGQGARVEGDAPLVAARSRPADEALLRDQLGRLGGTIYRLRGLDAAIEGDPMIPRSLLNQVRRDLVAKLEVAASTPARRRIAEAPVLPELLAPIEAERARQLAARNDDAVPRHASSPQASMPPSGEAIPSGPLPPPWGRVRERGRPPSPGEEAPGSSRDADFRSPAHPTIQAPSDPPLPNPPSPGGKGQNVDALHRGSARGATGELAVSSTPQLHDGLSALCRTTEQIEAAVAAGITTIYADYQDIKRYSEAVAAAREGGATIFLATPRIEKPAEANLFRFLEKLGPDGILVRNAGGLAFCHERSIPFVADFSLNAANPLSVDLLKSRGAIRVTASYDLNAQQLADLIAATPPDWLEIVIHQRIPMFHMEHCVFCAFLSPGNDHTNCGRPCDHHDVKLRDRVGVEHPLTADVGCRNTLYNAVPQTAAEFLPRFLTLGARQFRIEFLGEGAAAVGRTIGLYRAVIEGRRDAKSLWRELKATNQYGVTRGPLAVIG
ncbi:putative protease YhbU precursor [Aquisphaera giovannonii]|uniref:Putative protease YhbU n=1 Tax=Aquisphaera giovannonii TaxID=406548 RepID=A0A5B9VZ94_9BACT|nr:putative protease YhbU precursor [Aquisphaera giovannonii]